MPYVTDRTENDLFEKGTVEPVHSADVIELRDHDRSWHVQFQRERADLAMALGDKGRRIDHIGSTAVPGLRAKPVIDIMISVERLDLEMLNGKLASLGYVHVPIEGEGRLFFRKGIPRSHHLHVVEEGSEQYWHHIRFRDRLLAHPEEAAEYARLKECLAERYRSDRDAYTQGKEAFIKEILARAISEDAETHY